MRIQDRKKYTASGSFDSVYLLAYIATINRPSDEFYLIHFHAQSNL
jgi:hypothetical protein